jgi:hypothetical protein
MASSLKLNLMLRNAKDEFSIPQGLRRVEGGGDFGRKTTRTVPGSFP